MSYSTVHACAHDVAFTDRVSACIAQEQRANAEPVAPMLLLESMRWAVAAAPDVEAAYASALAADHPDPGGDEAVITDGMILANVQASWPEAGP